MADEGNVISDLNLDPVPNGADTAPAIAMISQYVKDLSVENPNAPASYQWQDAPQIGVDFNISAQSVGPDVHEIELKIRQIEKAAEQIDRFPAALRNHAWDAVATAEAAIFLRPEWVDGIDPWYGIVKPASVAKRSTRSTSTRPYQERS